MEANGWIVGVALLSSFATAMIVSHGLFGRLNKMRLASKIRQDSYWKRLVRNGVAGIKPLMEILERNTRIKLFFGKAYAVAVMKGHITTPSNIASLYGAGIVVLFLVSTVVGQSILFGFFASACCIVLSGMMISHAHEAYDDALRNAIPDALRSMGVCSFAGLSLLQTFNQVACEIEEPLKSLFLHAAHDLEAGRTSSETLEAFRKNSLISELAFIAVALDVQHKTGGSMQQVLDAACGTVENELELKRSLKVQTAQAKLSARIVSIMPFALVMIFSFISPDFLRPFFTSFAGYALLGLAVFMQVSGILMVRRMLSVRG